MWSKDGPSFVYIMVCFETTETHDPRIAVVSRNHSDMLVNQESKNTTCSRLKACYWMLQSNNSICFSLNLWELIIANFKCLFFKRQLRKFASHILRPWIHGLIDCHAVSRIHWVRRALWLWNGGMNDHDMTMFGGVKMRQLLLVGGSLSAYPGTAFRPLAPCPSRYHLPKSWECCLKS